MKLIGVYSSRELAQLAVERLARQPGFREALLGFSIEGYEIDRDHWAEGYGTPKSKVIR